MLQTIKLTNFQRHRSLEITFNAGISALRGNNEAGKSTLIRAICYALFGAKALPMPLSEAVTWGEPESTLKVELELAVDGVVCSIKRGKFGAEINYDGGIVTGQNECTAFIGRLLKADAGSASRLMLANQNEIRGALEKGAAETTKLIEQLAEFDQLDDLVELMQAELTLGSTATAEAAIRQAEASLDQAKAEAIPVSVEEHDKQIAIRRAELDLATKDLEEHDALVEELRAEAHRLVDQEKERAAADAAVGTVVARLQRARLKLEDSLAVPEPAQIDVPALRAQLTQLGDMSKVRAARSAVEPLLGQPTALVEDRFEGSQHELVADISQTRQDERKQRDLARDWKAAGDLAQSRISKGSCATCGQDIGHLSEVAERSADLERQVADAAQRAEKHGKAARVLAEYLEALEAVQKEAGPRLRLLDQYPDFLSADALLPPTLTWIGGEIPDDVGAEASNIEKEIAAFEKARRAHDIACGQADSARIEVTTCQAELDAAKSKCKALPIVDAEAAKSAFAAAQEKRPALATEQRTAQRALDSAISEKQVAIEGYERALRTASQAEKILAARRKELGELGFNNALMKAVRAARPLIADKLWNLVLSAVSRYFSEMRGTKSRVTKESDGFKVDGHSATTLSGSTLDILGLAIRIALTRTFLPTAPFLVLDEPAAAMDDERTQLMLGFLATAGFPQTLLVTHEDISESVADNIISI